MHISKIDNAEFLLKSLFNESFLNHSSMTKCTPNQHSIIANTQCLIYSLVKSLKYLNAS